MLNNLPAEVQIYEVGPRDGLQNEPVPVKTEEKLSLIKALSRSGLRRIEITSFVSPKWIPQLADGFALAKELNADKELKNLRMTALVPNEKGLEKAMEAGMKEIAIFMSATQSHNRKNINKSTEEAIEQLSQVAAIAKSNKLFLRGYLSTAFVCPYEGITKEKDVLFAAEKLMQMGVDELSVGDTIGGGTPKQVLSLVKALSSFVDLKQIALHFHDTYGMALANVLAGLEAGVTIFDSSVGGLGGCPYAPGAAGNLASEDLLNLLNGLGIKTGVDMDLLVEAGELAQGILDKPLPGRFLKASLASRTKAEMKAPAEISSEAKELPV